jgi:hypothetical protein
MAPLHTNDEPVPDAPKPPPKPLAPTPASQRINQGGHPCRLTNPQTLTSQTGSGSLNLPSRILSTRSLSLRRARRGSHEYRCHPRRAQSLRARLATHRTVNPLQLSPLLCQLVQVQPSASFAERGEVDSDHNTLALLAPACRRLEGRPPLTGISHDSEARGTQDTTAAQST